MEGFGCIPRRLGRSEKWPLWRLSLICATWSRSGRKRGESVFQWSVSHVQSHEGGFSRVWVSWHTGPAAAFLIFLNEVDFFTFYRVCACSSWLRIGFRELYVFWSVAALTWRINELFRSLSKTFVDLLLFYLYIAVNWIYLCFGRTKRAILRRQIWEIVIGFFLLHFTDKRVLNGNNW